MRSTIKILLAAALIAAMLAAFSGCHKKIEGGEPGVSETPKLTAGPSPADSASPSGSPASKETAGPGGSAGPSSSPGASGSPAGDSIEGFMEGEVVDPDSVPELISALAEHDEYRGLSVQSITYKYFGGRQAYYVILQGEGSASRSVYVFADGSVSGE